MHLHHELQRALAGTKIEDAGVAPRPEARTDTRPHRHAASDARRIRLLFWQRPAVRDARWPN